MTIVKSRIGLRRLVLADIPEEQLVTTETKAVDPRQVLALQVKTRLGFGLLADQVAQEQEKQTVANRLQRAASAKRQAYREIIAMLAAINADAVPYEPASVEGYKARMIRKDLPLLRRWLGKRSLGIVLAIFFLFSGVSVVMCFPVAFIFVAQGGMSNFCVLGLFISSAVVNWCATLFFDHYWSYEVGHWDKIGLEKYTRPVPEFALATAVAVKERLPMAKFFVDEFIPGHFPKLEPRPYNDPFMVVHLDGRDFYIDVWNEPDFKGQRIA